MTENLTRFVEMKYENFGTELSTFFLKTDFIKKIEFLKNCDASDVPSVCKEIIDMFKAVGVECELLQPAEYYKEKLKEIPGERLCETKEEYDKKIWSNLYGVYQAFPSPGVIMERILNNSGSPEFKKEKTLRLRILKEFIKKADGLKYAGYSGLTYVKKYAKDSTASDVFDIDDGVFDVLASATKEQRKRGGKYSLLVLADELGSGKFKNNGASKEPLLLLAIVLNMRYYEPGDKNYCAENDVVKNMFHDYYCDNLMRYITSYKNENKTAYEDEPMGLGLDYKNYAEAIFIYYLNNDFYTPAQKIEKIYAMLEEIKSSDAKVNTKTFTAKATISFKKNLSSELLSLDESEVADYVLNNYSCNLNRYSKDGKIFQVNPFELEFSQNTIYETYDLLRSYIAESLELTEEQFKRSMELINLKIRSKGTDLAVSEMYEQELDAPWELELNTIDEGLVPMYSEDFLILIKKFIAKLNAYKTLNVYDEKEDDIVKITRTKLIVAYFHFYCLESSMSDIVCKNFNEVFQDLETDLNYYLEMAGFSKLNHKNIFDMLIVFFAYCRINNTLYLD